MQPMATTYLDEMLASSVNLYDQDVYFEKKTLEDGSIFSVRKTYGRPIVTIYVPPKETIEEKKELSTVTIPQHIYAHAIFGSGYIFEAVAGIYDCSTKAAAEIGNPFYGIKGVDEKPLFPDAPKLLQFPARVLLDTEARAPFAGYYFNNPAKNTAIQVCGGLDDIRLGGPITAVTIVSGGLFAGVGSKIFLPAQYGYNYTTKQYQACGTGGILEVTATGTRGAVTGIKIHASGDGYVTSGSPLDVNYKGLTITITSAPSDETLHFHRWYIENCRDGNVQANKFTPTSDAPEHRGLWESEIEKDFDGNYLKWETEGTTNDTATTGPECFDSINGDRALSGQHTVIITLNETLSYAEPDQLREKHKIGLLPADSSCNKELILSAERLTETTLTSESSDHCSFTETELAECGSCYCGGYTYPMRPGLTECVAAVIECMYGWQGQSVAEFSYGSNLKQTYLTKVSSFKCFNPINSTEDTYDVFEGEESSAEDTIKNIIMNISHITFSTLCPMQWSLVNTYSGTTEVVELPASTITTTPYWYLINSDITSYRNPPPMDWWQSMVDQKRWRVVYNKRADESNDPLTFYDTKVEKFPTYFMQLYVYANCAGGYMGRPDPSIGRMACDIPSGLNLDFTVDPKDLTVHASVVEVDDPTSIFYYVQEEDEETGELVFKRGLIGYDATEVAQSTELSEFIKELAEGGNLSQLVSVNASFVTYDKTNPFLVDREKSIAL